MMNTGKHATDSLQHRVRPPARAGGGGGRPEAGTFPNPLPVEYDFASPDQPRRTVTGLLLYLPVNVCLRTKAVKEGWASWGVILALFVSGVIGFWAFERGGPVFIAVILGLGAVYLIASEMLPASDNPARRGTRMSANDNTLLVRRYMEEIVNTGEVERIGDFISPDYVERSMRTSGILSASTGPGGATSLASGGHSPT